MVPKSSAEEEGVSFFVFFFSSFPVKLTAWFSGLPNDTVQYLIPLKTSPFPSLSSYKCMFMCVTTGKSVVAFV